MNADHLHSFCIVAREGSVTAAASTLGLSQPAVSRHLRLLEAERGTPLYVRRGKGVALTPAGRALLPYACSVSQALLRAQEVLAGRVAPDRTRVHIGLSHHLTTLLTAPLLRATKLYNDDGYLLQLHLREGYTPDLIRGLREGSLDAAYILGTVDRAETNCTAQQVIEEAVVLMVRTDDPLGREESLPTSALEGETLVVPSSASSVYKMTMTALQETGTHPGRILEVSGPAAVRSAVHDGLGIGVTIRSFVDREVRGGALRLVGLDGRGLRAPVTKLTRNERFLLPDQQHALAYLGTQLGEEPLASALPSEGLISDADGR